MSAMGNVKNTSGEKKEPLVAETLANAAHEAVDSVTKKASAAEESIRSTASESSEAIQEKLETAKKDLGELSAKVERYARTNPLAAAGIAFVAGIVVTSVLRR